MASFGERLKTFRLQKELSQADLARALDVSQTTIASYERGDRRPRQNLMVKIAQYFSVSPNELLGYEKSQESYTIEGLLTVPVFDYLPYETSLKDIDYITRYAYLPDDGQYNVEKLFFFITPDNAMEGYSRIQYGDTLIVHGKEEIKDGDIAVLHINESEAVIRRVYNQANSDNLLLIPDNAYYNPLSLPPNEVKIRGKVVQVIFSPK